MKKKKTETINGIKYEVFNGTPIKDFIGQAGHVKTELSKMKKEFNLPEAVEDIREREMKIKLKEHPKEFNLSKKIFLAETSPLSNCLCVYDVKEFIKRLKDELCLQNVVNGCNNCLICDTINRNAGDKLIK